MNKQKRCPVCEKGELIKAEDIIMDVSGYVFVIRGEKCNNCNEEFPFEEETQRVIEASRKLGVWPEPLKLHRNLSRSGGTLIFRVPIDLEKQLHLKAKEEIAIAKVGNKIVIEPLG